MTDGSAERGAAGAPGWAWLQGAVALVVLGLFLWTLRGVLNPFLLFFVLWGVMLPFRGRPGHGAVLGIAALLTVFWLLSTTGALLAPFILALVLAYMLDPAVDALQRRGIPRVRAIVVLTLPLVGLLALLLFVAIPAAVEQLAQLVNQAPVLFERLADWIEVTRERILRVDIPLLPDEQFAERLRAIDSDAIVSFVDARREELADWVWGGLLGVGRGLGAVLGALGFIVLAPVLTFYLLRDWDGLTGAAADLVPPARRPAVLEFAREYDDLLARYLRGQATVAALIGLLTGLGLWITSFPYAWTLGLIVAVFSVVPYLGLLLSLAPALFIALLTGNVLWSLVKVAAVYGVAQGLEGAVISPRILGDSVGLHPVLVVLALALGGFFFGFVGLLIGVPAAVGIKLLVERGVAYYKASRLYRGEAAA